ncbi:11479_t:CDS:2 [Ambispora gerdemannii]|uniref:11479_t:CDS:1 n=1 Tax=Ambispora gerdemannii TaxID=144530 RepID=A0A9N9GLP8_9GLOM|nr:11479_t:CDS:2 [Ambispora gerdemannii]
MAHEQQSDNDQEFIQLICEQRSDNESDCGNENDEYIIRVGATFPKWESLESALKKIRVRNWIKAIKFRMERENNGAIIHRYFVKIPKSINLKKDRQSFPCKEIATSLRSLSQEVLDDIKFLTQECSLGAQAQRRYLSKNFPINFYMIVIYIICQYKNQMGSQRENDAADMVKWLMKQQEQEPG